MVNTRVKEKEYGSCILSLGKNMIPNDIPEQAVNQTLKQQILDIWAKAPEELERKEDRVSLLVKINHPNLTCQHNTSSTFKWKSILYEKRDVLLWHDSKLLLKKGMVFGKTITFLIGS